MGEINADVVEAITNEYQDIRDMLTDKVKVERLPAPAGSDCLWKFVVYAPAYIIKQYGDTHPVRVDHIVFYLDVKHGFPKAKPEVRYEKGQILASINTFASNGVQCIDDWLYDEMNAGKNSSLAGTVRKTLMDIIHEPSVSRYDSMANSSLADWQRSMTEKKAFPTCPLNQLIRGENGTRNKASVPPLPGEQQKKARKVAPPALP